MLSVLFEGGAVLDYGYIGDHNVDVLAALAAQPPPCLDVSNIPSSDELRDIAAAAGIGIGGDCGDDCEECEDMPIVHVKGQAYLLETCGCGDSNFYPLGDAANLGIDAATGEAALLAGDTGGVKFEGKEDYKACYTDAAVPFLLGRCVAYQGLLAELLATAIDFASAADEFVDLVALAEAWLKGDPDMADWAGLVNNTVEAAFADATFQQTMMDAWEAKTSITAVTRQDLIYWIQDAPQFVNGVPVRWLLKDWAKYCRLDTINRELSRFAAACQGETSYNPFPDPGYSDIDINGTTYRVWAWEPDEVLTGSGDEWVLPSETSGFEVRAILATVTMGASGNLTTYLSNDKLFLHASLPSGTVWIGSRSDADAELALEEFYGAALSLSAANTGTSPTPKIYAHTLSQPATITAAWAVGVLP